MALWQAGLPEVVVGDEDGGTKTASSAHKDFDAGDETQVIFKNQEQQMMKRLIRTK